MKRFFIGIICLIATAQADEKFSLRRPPTGKILRDHRNEVRSYFLDLVLRKAQSDVANSLIQQGMPTDEVQVVLQSEGMQSFLKRLKDQPEVQKLVDDRVNRLLAPGVIEAYFAAQQQKAQKELQERVIVARSEMAKSAERLQQEDVFDPVDERSLWTKMWDYLLSDLNRASRND